MSKSNLEVIETEGRTAGDEEKEQEEKEVKE